MANLFKWLIVLIVVLLNNLSNCEEDRNPLARGFGDKINWVNFEESAKIAKETSKPIFLLIHKTWCGSCQSLKPKLAQSLQFQELSENFVMVNVEDDEEPRDEKYSPDGGYIPRILFADSSNNLKPEIYNVNGNPKYKYYYATADQVISAMENTLRVFSNYKTSINEDKTSNDNNELKDEF